MPRGKNQPESETRRSVREMRGRGMNPRQISLALGITTQRVYQQIAAIEKQAKAS